MAAKKGGGGTKMTQIHRGTGSQPGAGKLGGMPAGNGGGKPRRKGK